MPYCPECGGEMQYIMSMKQFVCKSCGLTLTKQELIEARIRLHPDFKSEKEKRQEFHKEYLKWWLGKKR